MYGYSTDVTFLNRNFDQEGSKVCWGLSKQIVKVVNIIH